MAFHFGLDFIVKLVFYVCAFSCRFWFRIMIICAPGQVQVSEMMRRFQIH